MKIEKDKDITVGKLGEVSFKKGYYTYIGSALGSLEGRINRHLRKEKRLKWHIDYLLIDGRIDKIFIFETTERLECITARKVKKNLTPVKNFGSSDCSCDSHLFYSKEIPAHLFEDLSSFPA
ncbi:MAG: GIY-YIG nuclease family protein, partial [Candidatus Hydrothermarchaeaceae archaeon]